jgi:hypothetical protein
VSQDERLFGAPNRYITQLQMTLLRPGDGGASVVIECQGNSRQRAHRMHVNLTPEQSPSTVLGLCAPLLHLHYVMPSRWVQQAARTADRLGAEGYEVTLS